MKKRQIILLIAVILFIQILCFAQDGPYIVYNSDGSAEVITFDRNLNMHTQSFADRESIGELTIYTQEGGYSFTVNLHDFNIPAARYELPEQMLLMSDPHGDFVPFVQVLKGNGVINEEFDWIYGTGHLAILGDVMDRGDDQTTIFWLIYKLEEQARLAGGAVHFLIGNHEVMITRNDLRYLTPKYLTVSEISGIRYDRLWNDTTELGRWLLSRNTITILDEVMLVHGGISPELVATTYTIEEVNDVMRQHMLQGRGAALITGNKGPTWYRGIVNQLITEEELDEILARFEVTQIIMGHTRVSEISSLYDGKAVALDISNDRMNNILTGKSLGLILTPNGFLPLRQMSIDN